MAWKPIAYAPKDESVVLLRNTRECADGYWLQAAYSGNGAWIWPYIYKNPTHWMPLEPVPHIEEEK